MRIAVDAMGGDRAPEEIVLGVDRAVEHGFVNLDQVVLVGMPGRLAPLLDASPRIAQVAVEPASQVVGMHESPTGSLRSKPDSSLQVALRLVKSGTAEVFVSAGNTGAVVASSFATLGRLPGVKRPGIAVTFHSAEGPVTLLDVGANVHCKPEHLLHYGLMASVFSREVLEVQDPKVGLLNIGEEDGKGNSLVLETTALFRASGLNFVGNVEGNDLYSGRCNVVVCEGFVGNVVLKVTEGVAGLIFGAIQQEVLARLPADSEEGQQVRQVLGKLDYAEYGGAPLLGVDGQVMIMHGRSDRRAVASALRVARQFLEAGVSEKIREALSRWRSNGGEQQGVAP